MINQVVELAYSSRETKTSPRSQARAQAMVEVGQSR